MKTVNIRIPVSYHWYAEDNSTSITYVAYLYRSKPKLGEKSWWLDIEDGTYLRKVLRFPILCKSDLNLNLNLEKPTWKNSLKSIIPGQILSFNIDTGTFFQNLQIIE